MTTAELTSDWPGGAVKMHGNALQLAVIAAGLSEPLFAAAGFCNRKTAVLLITNTGLVLATEKRFAVGAVEVRSFLRGQLGSITTSPKRRFSRMSLTLEVPGGPVTIEGLDPSSLHRVLELLSD